MAHHQRDLINKDEPDRLKLPVNPAAAAPLATGLPSPLSLPPPAVACSASLVSPRDLNTAPQPQLPEPVAEPTPSAPTPAPACAPAPAPPSGAPSRCASCRKRLGLAGFQCRCGSLFCGVHRYSDRHACSFDYKAQAREAIARDNPVYKAPKLLKI